MSRYKYSRTEPYPARAIYEVRLGNVFLGHVWQGTRRVGWCWSTADGRHGENGWETREGAARELQRRVEARTGTLFSKPEKGWYGLVCWNGLSSEQQQTLIEKGVLPINYRPHGTQCSNGAEVAVETMWDAAPGPRFYCTECAVEFLKARKAVKTS